MRLPVHQVFPLELVADASLHLTKGSPFAGKVGAYQGTLKEVPA